MNESTENKLTYDQQSTLIRILTDKANGFETEIVKQGIQIEGLKQKNIVLTDKLEAKKKELVKVGDSYFVYRRKSTERIDNLETAAYWGWIREAAMAITILGFIVYHVIN